LIAYEGGNGDACVLKRKGGVPKERGRIGLPAKKPTGSHYFLRKKLGKRGRVYDQKRKGQSYHQSDGGAEEKDASRILGKGGKVLSWWNLTTCTGKEKGRPKQKGKGKKTRTCSVCAGGRLFREGRKMSRQAGGIGSLKKGAKEVFLEESIEGPKRLVGGTPGKRKRSRQFKESLPARKARDREWQNKNGVWESISEKEGKGPTILGGGKRVQKQKD